MAFVNINAAAGSGARAEGRRNESPAELLVTPIRDSALPPASSFIGSRFTPHVSRLTFHASPAPASKRRRIVHQCLPLPQKGLFL
jgi:hypothetical protein